MVRFALLLLYVITLYSVISPSAQAQGGRASGPIYVAYVEHVYPVSIKLAQAISIRRQGHVVITTDNADLSAGDEIRILNPEATVVVRIVATRAAIAVRHHVGNRANEPDFTVPRTAVPGLLVQAFTFMKLASLSANQARGDTIAASRGTIGTCFNSSGQTNVPIAFDVPALTADRSLLTAGERRLFVSWRGGAAPFSVVLADALSGAVLARTDGVRNGCGVRLPSANIISGRQYSLAVIDGNGLREEDDDIYGVIAAPAAPAELGPETASEGARRIYIATWLTLQGRGEWTFEAEQNVAALGCTAPGTREWLASIAGSAECMDN
jgi:hypothetical protein